MISKKEKKKIRLHETICTKLILICCQVIAFCVSTHIKQEKRFKYSHQVRSITSNHKESTPRMSLRWIKVLRTALQMFCLLNPQMNVSQRTKS
jgi:hypothetical protein